MPEKKDGDQLVNIWRVQQELEKAKYEERRMRDALLVMFARPLCVIGVAGRINQN